jgi:hypothetical protein
MCKKNNPRRIDPCMEKIVWLINNKTEYKTLSCCCGHGKYPMTIVVDNKRGTILEYFSQIEIPRKARFYIKDKQGLYFIPEVKKWS